MIIDTLNSYMIARKDVIVIQVWYMHYKENKNREPSVHVTCKSEHVVASAL